MVDVNLTGQVALVTGGGRGLGQAFARALASAGAAVAITARSEEQLAETAGLIGDAHGGAIAISGDVTDPRDVERVVSTAERQLGEVDILVNNAGVALPSGPMWEVDADDWWRTVEVNLRGAFLYTRSVLPSMIARRRGRIINVSSGAVYAQNPFATAYVASKGALTLMGNCLDGEVREYGISVLTYTPGLVRTAMSESPDLHELIRERFRARFEEGSDTPLELAVRQFMFLASGRADAMSGRSVAAGDDLDELLERAEEILQQDLFTLRLRQFAPQ